MSAAAMVLFCSGCDNGEEFQTPPSVEGIVLSRDEIVLEKGQKAVLEYVIQPDGAVPEGEVGCLQWNGQHSGLARRVQRHLRRYSDPRSGGVSNTQ